MNNTSLNPIVQQKLDFKEVNKVSEQDEFVKYIPAGIMYFETDPRRKQIDPPTEEYKIKQVGSDTRRRYITVAVKTFQCEYVDPDIEVPTFCPRCGRHLNNHGKRIRKIYDCPLNGDCVTLEVRVRRVKCSDRNCNYSHTYKPDFEVENHRITKKLRSYIEFLLLQNLNLKTISIMTGVSKNVVKDIDKERLNDLYTDDGKTLKKPTTYSRRLAVDEFLLHKGHKYATVIIDLDTGHILHLSHGKKKACVTEFINRVGLKWMSHVEAIACDMNSDFEEAFKEQCPHLSIVFDRFHIVKNFNEKVIANIRKDEQRRLKDLGDEKGAKLLKDSKYKLIANEATRKLHDVEADQGKVIKKESKLFNGREYKRKGGECEHYNKIIKENELFFIVDYVKELLKYAYTVDTRNEMESVLGDIVELCVDSKNKHMYWFAKLIVNHIEGIVTYADHKISTGKLEGMNNKIKTIRRKAYGYNDDEYFFLKLFDASRN